MFKHILLPTDGSPLSENAMRQCLQFAKETGAKVTSVHVIPDFHLYNFNAELVATSKDQYVEDFTKHAHHHLDKVASAAQEIGVPCETSVLRNDHPYEAIISAAEQKDCDLIAMATHGKKGLKGLLVGSETQKVLTHSQIPVLVFH